MLYITPNVERPQLYFRLATSLPNPVVTAFNVLSIKEPPVCCFVITLITAPNPILEY